MIDANKQRELELQLENKRAVLASLSLEALAMNKTVDILAVEREISILQSEIEKLLEGCGF